MAKKKKISKEELDSIKSYLEKKNNILLNIGSLEVQKQNASIQLKIVEEDFSSIKIEMEQKYGKVSINPNDGTYESINE